MEHVKIPIRTIFARKTCTFNASKGPGLDNNCHVKRCRGGTITEDKNKTKKMTLIILLKSFIERKCSENLKDYMLPFLLKNHSWFDILMFGWGHSW